MKKYLREFIMEYMSYKKVFTCGSTFIICFVFTCMCTFVLGKTNYFKIHFVISKIMVGIFKNQNWEILLSEIILKRLTPNTKCIIVIQETCDKHIPIIKHSLKELKRPSRLVKQAPIRSTAGCPIRNSNCLTFASNWVHPRLLGWFRVDYYFSFLLVFFIYYFCLSSS